ncbi:MULTISPECIES: dodecin [unclassified Endozoicomonas]|uniref:dodecin n=1 Tax=unclassified Endozoicomonas TaxID=2644528 RepID=UPI0021474562|nr:MULTISPECIES: dodecin [unclassified Endozoicomonas]
MSHIYKILEVVGSSTVSSDDAIRNAIATASVTLNHLGWYEVVEHRGHIEDGEIAHFQVTVRIGFRLEDRGKAS